MSTVSMKAKMKRYSATQTLICSLLFSFSALSAPSETLIAQAENNDADAQLTLGDEYLKDKKIKLAHYWLSKSALNGNPQALVSLGTLFESPEYAGISRLSLSENWYQLGTEQNLKKAEQGYSRVLEEQFNQQRAKQVSAIAILDKAADESLLETPSDINTEKSIRENKINTEIILIGLVLLLMFVMVFLRRFIRTRKENKSADLNKLISEKDQKINMLQRSLNKTFEQLKKSQLQNQKQNKDQSYAVACAVLGFNPKNIPDDKAIKARYIKLCRVYHPDASGSDDEMKRLNAAVKVISSRKKQN